MQIILRKDSNNLHKEKTNRTASTILERINEILKERNGVDFRDMTFDTGESEGSINSIMNIVKNELRSQNWYVEVKIKEKSSQTTSVRTLDHKPIIPRNTVKIKVT